MVVSTRIMKKPSTRAQRAGHGRKSGWPTGRSRGVTARCCPAMDAPCCGGGRRGAPAGSGPRGGCPTSYDQQQRYGPGPTGPRGGPPEPGRPTGTGAPPDPGRPIGTRGPPRRRSIDDPRHPTGGRGGAAGGAGRPGGPPSHAAGRALGPRLDLGRRRARAAHMPGAAFVDLDEALSGPVLPDGHGGRHPVPDAEHFARAMRAAGGTDRPPGGLLRRGQLRRRPAGRGGC